jgi:hypothetical protein
VAELTGSALAEPSWEKAGNRLLGPQAQISVLGLTQITITIVFFSEVLLGENPGEDRIVVMLKVPRETLQRRMDNRKSHFAKSNLIESQLAALEMPERPDDEQNLVLVDGSLPVEGVLNEILRILDFM